jgi:hypothetical protein
MVGQNPRKGVTHTREDVAAELADVAFTALVAIESLGLDARTVLDECVLRAGVEVLAARRCRLEAEVQADSLGAGRVRVELRRNRNVTDVGAVQPVDADPGVDEPVREALGGDDRLPVVLREREPSGSRLPQVRGPIGLSAS